MKKLLAGAALCVSAAVAGSSPADAGTTLSASGKITSIATLLNYVSTSTPAGTVHIGDSYTLTAEFDMSRAELGALFDSDPTINIYDLPGATVSLMVGSYRTTFTPIFDFDSTIQIWNDSGTPPVDSESFEFFRYQAPQAEVPFEMGSGMLSESVTLDAFDFTAAARNDDLISSMTPLSAFASRSFSVGLLNSSTGLFVFLGGSVSDASLTENSVPEPAPWAMLMVGFGMIGVAVRTRRMRITASPCSI